MGFFLFILILLIVLIAMPVFRVARRINSLRSQLNDMASQARQAYGDGRKTDETPRPKRRRKRISKDVGEYVDYEEVTVVAEQTTEYHEYSGVVEDQVSDAEWEDVK